MSEISASAKILRKVMRQADEASGSDAATVIKRAYGVAPSQEVKESLSKGVDAGEIGKSWVERFTKPKPEAPK
jgi:hypothetical protein